MKISICSLLGSMFLCREYGAAAPRVELIAPCFLCKLFACSQIQRARVRISTKRKLVARRGALVVAQKHRVQLWLSAPGLPEKFGRVNQSHDSCVVGWNCDIHAAVAQPRDVQGQDGPGLNYDGVQLCVLGSAYRPLTGGFFDRFQEFAGLFVCGSWRVGNVVRRGRMFHWILARDFVHLDVVGRLALLLVGAEARSHIGVGAAGVQRCD